MQQNLIEINSCNQQLDITLSVEELKPKFDAAYKKAAPSIEIKGFRKGKVPFNLIKKYFGQSIELDSIQDIANECFQNSITEKNIEPIGQPSLVNINYKPNEPLSFTIKFEVRPKIELKKYKGLEVKKYKHTLKDDEFDNELNRILQSNATYEESQKVDGKDFLITVDMQEFDENNSPIEKRKNENVKINLSENSTEVEIKEALKNAETGKDYFAQFEHKHDDHSHKVNLKLSVKKIEKIILPELNSDLVKKITKDKITEVEEFSSTLKKDLENYWVDQYERKFLDDLINSLVSNHEFDVPESLVSGIQDGFLDELKTQLNGKQFPQGFDQNKYKETMKPRAIWQAKWFLLRAEIIKSEQLSLNDDDFSKLAETESTRMGIDKETLINFYKSSEKSQENLLNEKLFTLLKENAKISELDDSEIEKK